ncbi:MULTISPECIES: hypothetical protein [unclassified Bradyrhizobium]|uniref:hypothetical protein n=1 Tax=unclassified Bradyrhizobium TaxID=2631580 RepID=UPI001FF783F4|nr:MULTISPECIES: hypothetical protein [unclassified Bradyrhizobium]MCK1270835.1 hypothetical protein [Bradyrhizobium sp. 84]MCK1372142.1 hypothetical protein [Bradyrhizobium sp. 49]MCK1417613.1 hypothetical protein [Bradyrhizobium sp. CW4]MCK1430587.1 hypothetical protein [Bradyrhizobium sp. 87]
MTKPVPRRIAARPDPAAWSDEEVLTLAEAAALLFPQGPITESFLRTAYRKKMLEVILLNRKLLTCKRSVREMLERASRKPTT